MGLGVFVAMACLLLPAVGGAAEPKTSSELTACMRRNTPEPDSIRALRIVTRDRVGSERLTVVKLFGRRTEDGRRQIRVQVEEPLELRGDSLLILEEPGGFEMYFKSSDSPKAKRIRGNGRTLPLFGSDFTYEDFAHALALNRPGPSKRIEDDRIGDRPVYVIQTRVVDRTRSSYDSIETYVDQERCMALRIEFFDRSDQLRKVLSVNPAQVLKRGDIWIAHMSTLRDLRDHTTTQLFVDSTEQDVRFEEDAFRVEAVGGDLH